MAPRFNLETRGQSGRCFQASTTSPRTCKAGSSPCNKCWRNQHCSWLQYQCSLEHASGTQYDWLAEAEMQHSKVCEGSPNLKINLRYRPAMNSGASRSGIKMAAVMIKDPFHHLLYLTRNSVSPTFLAKPEKLFRRQSHCAAADL